MSINPNNAQAKPISTSKNEVASIFKKSKFTIRFKLLLIISTIILFSLSTIISIATYVFKNNARTTIEENTLGMTLILTDNLSSKFLALSKNLKLAAENLIEQEGAKGKDKDFKRIFFENDSDVLFLGVYKQEGEELVMIEKLYNENKQTNVSTEENDFISTANAMSTYFVKSFAGATILRNASPIFKAPILGFSIPFKEIGNKKTIIVSFIRLNAILESFQTSGIASNFLVDEEGNLLAHPNIEFITKGKNVSNSPIVKSMLTSNVSNKYQRFLEEDNLYYLGSFKKLGFMSGGVISTVNEDRAFEEVYNLQRRNIYLMIIVLMLSILFVYFYANSLTNPILTLVDASHEVETGNYQVNLKVGAHDEIGILTNSFNSMTKGLDEREKMKDAFGKFVNKDIAEMAMKGEIKLGGERKYCAIFFSDIRSFTSISEKLEPEEVVEFLNQYMTEMVKCITATHGIVDKFIGDAIMATWGALHHDDMAVVNAINGTLMMREALIKFNVGRGGDKKPIIQIGSGINSGYVISGQIGSNERLEYTVIGDAVNLASRIESLNKPFGTDILISEEAYSKVKDIFHVEKMQAIKVKGKEDPQTIFAVLGRKDDPNCIKTLPELRTLLNIKYEAPEPAAKGKKKKSDDEEKEVKYEILE
ncbi:MAG: HAMP domain-containing protein [Leptospiraceae bacterium]|jgi:adenylate cyclase|nr:HAMP domain-containing protein [Leptospiraceae bacterium]